MLPGTNPLVILNLVQSGGKQAALGADRPAAHLTLELTRYAALGKLFPFCGPGFSQFDNR